MNKLHAAAPMDPERFRTAIARAEAELGRLIVGQQETIRLVLVALVADGHILLEGVPGLGKTLLMRSLARVVDGHFQRIQFTPDLMPADILGTLMLFEEAGGSRSFRFEPGPVFSNFVLADEINRGTPKTQSALLEAMQEATVTVGRQTYPLPQPFFVMATQNPLEMEGTFPLPEAQLDRFMFKLEAAYPSVEELVAIMGRTTGPQAPQPERALDASDLLAMQALAREVPIATEVLDYGARLLRATHPTDPAAPERVRSYSRLGASPRGLQAMVLGAKSLALLAGRHHVSRADLRALAAPALRHRIAINFAGQAEGVHPDLLVGDIVRQIPD